MNGVVKAMGVQAQNFGQEFIGVLDSARFE